jgi:3-hydroxymyristoyl/3-hydroxydecanoyl-(acyl carrier protein) dehydratase
MHDFKLTTLDIHQIMDVPTAPDPFLLVDRVIELSDELTLLV